MTIRDPEYFRGMSPGAMLQTLILDAADERHKQAQAAGARCHRCLDTGMDAGRFCGCEPGRVLAAQAMRPMDAGVAQRVFDGVADALGQGHRGPAPRPGTPSNTPSGTGSGRRP